jgi:hypothetical protein
MNDMKLKKKNLKQIIPNCEPIYNIGHTGVVFWIAWLK